MLHSLKNLCKIFNIIFERKFVSVNERAERGNP